MLFCTLASIGILLNISRRAEYRSRGAGPRTIGTIGNKGNAARDAGKDLDSVGWPVCLPRMHPSDKLPICSLRKKLRERFRCGEITSSVRIWIRPQVRACGRYRMEEGEVEVDLD